MRFIPVAIILILIQACATQFTKGLKEAELLIQNGDLEGAYTKLTGLCEERPESEACTKKEEIRVKIGNAILDGINSTIEKKRIGDYLPVADIPSLMKEAERLKTFGFAQEADSIARRIQEEDKKTRGHVKALIAKAEELIEKKDLKKAIEILTDAEALDREVGKIRTSHLERISEALLKDAERFAGEENWREAHRILRDIKALNPGYKGLAERLKEAEKKDSLSYYLKEADDAIQREDFDRALMLYHIARTYPDSEGVDQKILRTRTKGVQTFFQKGIGLAEMAQPYKAYIFLKKAMEFLADVPVAKRASITVPTRAINKYLDELSGRAKKEEEKGNYGLAYQFLHMVVELDPNYPDGKKRLRELEEKVAQRAIKGLAVIPFKSPAHNPESGKIFSSNITIFLYKNITPDIKVVEREAIETLLKEYEVKLAGRMNESEKERENFLQLLGADYLLFGDVHEYKVEHSQHETYKTVRARIGVKKVKNPEYEEWLAEKEKAEKMGEEVPPAPERYIQEPVYEDIKYRVVFFKKVGLVSVSYRIVDIKGKLLHTSFAEIKEEATGESTEGVDVGDFKVPMKIAELPSDLEIMRLAQNRAIQQIGGELKKIFQNPELKYLKKAEELEKEGAFVDAIERFSDAQLIYRKKNKDTTEIDKRIGRLIDTVAGI